jgi:outer membrane protein assembly factor BamE (lipoprotein component of BamABCDE complex)
MGLSMRLSVFAALAGVSVIGGCTPSVVTHGHQLDGQKLAQITPGVTSREEVARLLGTPSTVATFNDGNWYYISQRYEGANFFQQDLVAQDVVTVTFDDRGVVSDIEKSDMTTAMAIQPDPDQTRTMGNELSVIQQLLGNLGRFNREGSVPGQATNRRPGGL